MMKCGVVVYQSLERREFAVWSEDGLDDELVSAVGVGSLSPGHRLQHNC